jgi:hypothetical protein
MLHHWPLICSSIFAFALLTFSSHLFLHHLIISGYDWDVTNNNALPVMDDPNLHGYNVDARVEG